MYPVCKVLADLCYKSVLKWYGQQEDIIEFAMTTY